jgi:hypothetical protein
MPEETVELEELMDKQEDVVEDLKAAPIQLMSEFLKYSTYDYKAWSDFALSQLEEDELFNGNPTCDGLRRLVETYIGDIVSRKVHVHKAPQHNEDLATVSVEITVCPRSELWSGDCIIEESVADCGPYNTPDKTYARYQSAMAETRAEARAYRKLLRLKKTVAAEELAGECTMVNSASKIDNSQLTIIDMIAKRCDIDVPAFIKHCGYDDYNNLTHEVGAELIQRLNEVIQTKIKLDIPSYNPQWR